MFRVGQKVVCVDDSPCPEVGKVVAGFFITDEMDGLRRSEVYTVRNFYFDPVFSETLVRLQEIVRSAYPEASDEPEPGFALWRFRPIVERKTDISVFKEILREVTKRAPSSKESQHAG